MERPVLKYNGAKWNLGPWILQHFPNHRVYVDLFGGGGSVLLQKARSRFEYYNDIDGRLVNFFAVLRDHPLQLIRRIKYTPYARTEFVSAGEPSMDPIEDARRFYVHCWMSITQNASGGTFRVRGNLQEKGPKTGRYIPAKLFADLGPLYGAAERFRGVHVMQGDFAELIPKTDQPDTLFYADPEYLYSARRGGKLYDHEFGDEESHRRLHESLSQARGMVVLSGYRSGLYEELYESAGWSRVERETRDNKRNKAIECLWLNPACQKALGQQDLFAGLLQEAKG